MRERPALFIRAQLDDRITPARAGKTPSKTGRECRCGDHPRSCGKDFTRQCTHIIPPGSPPLVRERLGIPCFSEAPPRITPARAGKTIPECAVARCYRDHPRSCGKDPEPHHVGQCEPGSPPLVRERQTTKNKSSHRTRITPARAGKTYLYATDNDVIGDHPRSCGKDSGSTCLNSYVQGSPPLVRERLQHFPSCNAIRGITPARAGKTITKAL